MRPPNRYMDHDHGGFAVPLQGGRRRPRERPIEDLPTEQRIGHGRWNCCAKKNHGEGAVAP